MKKFIMLLLVYSLFVPQFCITSYALDFRGNLNSDGNVSWNFNQYTGELSIEGYGDICNYTESPFERLSSKIRSVRFDSDITCLGEKLFSDCSEISSVSLPYRLRYISNFAFENCTSLTSITIPDNLKGIGYSAFDGCSSLSEFVVNSAYNKFSTLQGMLTQEDKIVKVPPAFVCEGRFEIPDNISQIYSKAFYDNSTINEVVIGQSVNYVGNMSFCNSNVRSVYIYNTDCALYYDSIFDEGTVIHCYVNSTAYYYCIRTGLRYDLLSESDCVSHSFMSYEVQPNCNQEGYTVYRCKKCGYETKADFVDPLKHSYVKILTPATFDKNGKIEKRCKNCNKLLSSQVISKLKSVNLSNIEYIYNGKIRKPAVSAYDNKGNKISSSYYTVSYPKNNCNVGKHIVKIKFKGNYKDEKSPSFIIIPKGTSFKTKKAIKGQKVCVTWTKVNKQIDGYQLEISASKSFKNVKKYSISKDKTSKTVKADKAKTKYYFRIRTYKTADGKKYFSAWSKTISVKSLD